MTSSRVHVTNLTTPREWRQPYAKPPVRESLVAIEFVDEIVAGGGAVVQAEFS